MCTALINRFKVVADEKKKVERLKNLKMHLFSSGPLTLHDGQNTLQFLRTTSSIYRGNFEDFFLQDTSKSEIKQKW